MAGEPDQSIHRKAEPVAAKDQAEDQPDPTHDLYLADGSCVESAGAVPTHIAVGDRVIPVLRAVER